MSSSENKVKSQIAEIEGKSSTIQAEPLQDRTGTLDSKKIQRRVSAKRSVVTTKNAQPAYPTFEDFLEVTKRIANQSTNLSQLVEDVYKEIKASNFIPVSSCASAVIEIKPKRQLQFIDFDTLDLPTWFKCDYQMFYQEHDELLDLVLERPDDVLIEYQDVLVEKSNSDIDRYISKFIKLYPDAQGAISFNTKIHTNDGREYAHIISFYDKQLDIYTEDHRRTGQKIFALLIDRIRELSKKIIDQHIIRNLDIRQAAEALIPLLEDSGNMDKDTREFCLHFREKLELAIMPESLRHLVVEPPSQPDNEPVYRHRQERDIVMLSGKVEHRKETPPEMLARIWGHCLDKRRNPLFSGDRDWLYAHHLSAKHRDRTLITAMHGWCRRNGKDIDDYLLPWEVYKERLIRSYGHFYDQLPSWLSLSYYLNNRVNKLK